MSKPLFDVGLGRQTKQILVIGGIALAALAVYEFSANAGQEAGSGIGTAAIVVGSGVAVYFVISAFLI
jgi:hypothetical protein